MKIVGIVGSVRARSSNAAVLRAAGRVAPSVALARYEAIGALPWFNPELDGDEATAPPAVAALRATLAAADAVIVCSPEYAHGVPGALKNALDWLVSTAALVGKPVAVWTVSPSGGAHAQAQLGETLRTMSWRLVDEAGLRLALGRAAYDADGELDDAATLDVVRAAVAALAAAARR